MKAIAHYHEESGIMTIQRAEYIEDGWYVEIGEKFNVFEIPQYGGDPQHIAEYDNIKDAMDLALSLT